MSPKANQIYKHFKGNLYRIITIAKHSETEEKMVVYQALYGEYQVYTRPLYSFVEVLDKEKYPYATQEYRFELVTEMVAPLESEQEVKEKPAGFENPVKEANAKPQSKQGIKGNLVDSDNTTKVTNVSIEIEEGIKDNFVDSDNPVKDVNVKEETKDNEDLTMMIDPMLEAYLDTDSYREKLNILHGLRHRITEHMLLTMAVVIDFELPEGSIEAKYDALNDCLLTKERYECNRMI